MHWGNGRRQTLKLTVSSGYLSIQLLRSLALSLSISLSLHCTRRQVPGTIVRHFDFSFGISQQSRKFPLSYFLSERCAFDCKCKRQKAFVSLSLRHNYSLLSLSLPLSYVHAHPGQDMQSVQRVVDSTLDNSRQLHNLYCRLCKVFPKKISPPGQRE